MEVAVLKTGTANLASVIAACERLGATPQLVTNAEAVAQARHLIVPGVGAFGACMAALQAMGVVDALRQRLQDADQPTLAVCMGLQLFCQGSEESPGVRGVGAVHGVVRRFGGDDVRVPQLGWNDVRPQGGCQILVPGMAYFAHSYRLTDAPAGWHAALTNHGGLFVSGLERGPVLLCQFHPELSGDYGAALLGRWLETI